MISGCRSGRWPTGGQDGTDDNVYFEVEDEDGRTDPRFQVRNAQYLSERFGSSEAYCVLTRVPIVDSATLTPDWMSPESRLFEWAAQ